MANKRKFASAAELSARIDTYFGAISATEDVTRMECTGKDKNGKPIYDSVPVKDRNGDNLTRTVWYTPPTIGGLCLHLGIHRKTLGEYASRGKAYREAVENARSVIAAYLEEKISDPDIRNVKGVQLALETLLKTLEEERASATVRITNMERAALIREMIDSGFAELAEESKSDDEEE